MHLCRRNNIITRGEIVELFETELKLIDDTKTRVISRSFVYLFLSFNYPLGARKQTFTKKDIKMKRNIWSGHYF